jgi:hypothetical protein
VCACTTFCLRGLSHVSARGHLYEVCLLRSTVYGDNLCAVLYVPHLCTRSSARGPSHVLCTRSPNQLSYISARGHLHAVRPTSHALHALYTRSLKSAHPLPWFTTHTLMPPSLCLPSKPILLSPVSLQSHWRLATRASPARRPPVTMGHSPD